MFGELLTRWTIRGALVLYALFLAGRLALPARKAWRRVERPLWTAACMLFLAHLAAAMHFYHGWSNAAAVRDTAEQTEALLGLPFGQGIYFSYAFALLWVLDVLWWWIHPASYRRRGMLTEGLVHGYMFFIAFNGAVVFESGPTRWLGVPVTLALGLLAARRVLFGRQLRHSPLPLHARSTHRS